MDQRPIRQLRSVLDSTDYSSLEGALASVREVLDGRRIWHVNSTPQGGGVAELLSTLLPYAADAGVDAWWLVIEGRCPLLRDHEAHPQPFVWRRGRRRSVSARSEHRVDYEATLHGLKVPPSWPSVRGDLVIHPRPAVRPGSAPDDAPGAAPRVVWRCHVGTDAPRPVGSGDRLELLRRYLEAADRGCCTVFSPPFPLRAILDGSPPRSSTRSLPRHRLRSPRRTRSSRGAERSTRSLASERAFAPTPAIPSRATPLYERVGRLTSVGASSTCADILRNGPPPDPDVPLVVQVSRSGPPEGHAGRDGGLRSSTSWPPPVPTWCSPAPT